MREGRSPFSRDKTPKKRPREPTHALDNSTRSEGTSGELFHLTSQSNDLSLSIAETPRSAVTTDSTDCWGAPNRDL